MENNAAAASAAAAPAKPSIGFIGAGLVGSNLSQLAVKNGHHVIVSNSRGPETLYSLVQHLGPNAEAGTTLDAATKGDIVVVTVPLKAYKCVPADAVKGKIIIDTNNYYPGRDGTFPELDNFETTSSEMLQKHCPGAKVVKAFNTIVYFQMLSDGKKAGKHGRRALPIAGDDDAAKAAVAKIIDEFGFDVVDLGPLNQGKYFQPIPGIDIAVGFLGDWMSKKMLGFIPVYGVPHSAKDLRKALRTNGWKGNPKDPHDDDHDDKDEKHEDKEEKKKDKHDEKHDEKDEKKKEKHEDKDEKKKVKDEEKKEKHDDKDEKKKEKNDDKEAKKEEKKH